MNKNITTIFAILIILVGVGIYLYRAGTLDGLLSPSEEPATVEDVMTDDEAPVGAVFDGNDNIVEVSLYGQLEDVTAAQNPTVRGIEFDGNATGEVRITYTEGSYNLIAAFANLPELTNGDFYEGWIVDRDVTPLDVVSTGMLTESEGGVYKNTYTTDRDLTEHEFYVLTVEPDDGDPAPAEHVLEGVVEVIN